MNRLPFLLAMLLGSGMLSSCRLPRHNAEVMHGQVMGGKIPLYKTGTMGEFFRAGLILPDVGGYVRAEYDVLNIGKDGRVKNSSSGVGSKEPTVAQVAIPRIVSSFDLSRSSSQMRAALPASGEETGPLPSKGMPEQDPLIAEAASAPAATCMGPDCRPAAPSAPLVATAAIRNREAWGARPVIAANPDDSRIVPPPGIAQPSRPVPPPAPMVASITLAPAPQPRLWASNSYFQMVNLP